LRKLLLGSLTSGRMRAWLQGWGYDVTPIVRHQEEPIAVHIKRVLEALNINCVLDVGANEGQYAAMLRRNGYSGHILSFEPVQANFEALQRRHGKDAKWQGYDFALGSEEGTSEIQVTQHTVFSSFLSPNLFSQERFGGGSQVSSTQQVVIKRLDRIFGDLTKAIPEPRIFLKMDTQGYDLEVLRGAEGCLDRIPALQTEISMLPIYDNMPSHIEMLAELQSRQYVLTGMFPINEDELLRPVEFDCVAVRADA